MKFLPVLLLTGILVQSCAGQKNDEAGLVNAAEFEHSIQATPGQVLDVRTIAEFNTGHLAGALQADWNNRSQFTDRIAYLDKSKPVYVYCLSGARSNAAANWLSKNGFQKVIALEGGLIAWKKSQKPLEGTSPQNQMTLEQYQQQIPAQGLALVDFGASWCPPCVKMEPVLAALKEEKGDQFSLIRVDAGVHTAVMNAMGVDALPVFIVYKDGKEVWRKQGPATKEEFIAHLESR